MTKMRELYTTTVKRAAAEWPSLPTVDMSMMYNPSTNDYRFLQGDGKEPSKHGWLTAFSYSRFGGQSDVARGEDGYLYHSLDDPKTGKTSVTRLDDDE